MSYLGMLEDPRVKQPVSSFLPGVLGAYEIEDIYASVAPRPLLVINPQDSQRRGVQADRARVEWASAFNIYETLEAPGALQIESGLGRTGIRSKLGEWLTSLAS